MKTVRRNAPTGGLVRLGPVLAIVIGLFGMHVLSHHGMPHEPTPTAATALAGAGAARAGSGHSATRSEDALRATPVDGAHHARTGVANDPGVLGGTGHSLGDLLMLCVAMLAAVSTLLGLYALAGRTHRLWAILRPAASYLRSTRWLAPAGTGPPPLWQFSVIRC